LYRARIKKTYGALFRATRCARLVAVYVGRVESAQSKLKGAEIRGWTEFGGINEAFMRYHLAKKRKTRTQIVEADTTGIHKRSGVARLYVTHFFTHGVIEGAVPFSSLLLSLRLSFVYSAGITCARRTPRGRWDTTEKKKTPRPNRAVLRSRPSPASRTGKIARPSEKKVVPCARAHPEIGHRTENERPHYCPDWFFARPFRGIASLRGNRAISIADRSVTPGTNSICRGSLCHIPILSEQFTRRFKSHD